MLTKPKLSIGPDCSDLRDFYQYYNCRYFAIKQPDGSLRAACISTQAARGDTSFGVCVYNPETKETTTETITWNQLKKIGVFGSPMLGNTLLWDSYVYLSGYAIRESIKGIGLTGLEYTVPNRAFYVDRYATKRKTEISTALAQGHYFSYKEEMTLVHNILNKIYYSFNNAVHILEKGSRLGCPISKSLGLYLTDGIPDILVSYRNRPSIGRVVMVDDSYAIELKQEHKWLEPAIQMYVPNHVRIGISA